MVNENSNINLEDLKGYEHLFDNSRARYICPIFQRKFMWKVKGGTGKSQIIDFWADLEPVIFPENDDEHYVYLGAMIFKKYPESTSPYSVIDYLIIDRPIVFFNYDYEKYLEKNRKLQTKFLDTIPGAIAREQEGLEQAILDHLISCNDAHKGDRTKLKETSYEFFDGNSAQRIFCKFEQWQK